MSYYLVPAVDTGMGFSLKPPKWARKLTLKKVAIPLAVVAGAVLIPGVGGALVAAAGAAGHALASGAKTLGTGIVQSILPGEKDPFATANALPRISTPLPMTGATPSNPASPMAPTPTATTPRAPAAEVPWLPILGVAAAALILSKRN